MRRSHLKTAGSKVHFHIIVHDYRHGTPHKGHDHTLSPEPGIALVGGVDTYGRIAEYCLGAGCGHHNIAVLPFHHIFQMEQMAPLLLINHFLVGESGQRLRIPVYHPYSAVYQTLLEEMTEHPYHRAGTSLVHSEGGPLPVARRAKLAELLENHTPVLVSPVPCMLQEFFAGN